MKFFKFSFEETPRFVLVESDKSVVEIRGLDERRIADAQKDADLEKAKTLDDFVRSGYSYWDIEEIQEEELEAVLAETEPPPPVVEDEEEVEDAEGSDRGIDVADESSSSEDLESTGV